MYSLIDITNFKSIKKATAKLPSFGAIVGKNAVGKTNLIQSIQFVRDLAIGKNTSEAQKSISLIPNELFNFNQGDSEFGLDMTIKLKDESRYLLSIRVGLINGSVKPAVLLVNNEELYKLNEDESKELLYARDKNSLRDANDAIIPLAIDTNKLALSVYKTDHTERLKDVFVNTVIPDIENVYNVESITNGSAGDDYQDLANTIVSLHHNHPEKYDQFQVIIKKLLPHFSSLIEIPSKSDEPSPSPEKEIFLLVLEERNLKQKLSMQSVSSGDLKTLFLIATTLYMADSSTLLIEEIENGMHPKRIIDLIEHLETIARIKGMQIVFTTHSPIVINKLSASEVLLTDKDLNEGTYFTLLEDTEQISKIKQYLKEGGTLSDILHSGRY